MELSCPRCGAKNGHAEASAGAVACAACGAGAGVRGGGRRAYDGYAVGRRLLRLAPAWLLLLVVVFALSLLALSWASRRGGGPEGEAFRNEASNQPPTPDARAREGGVVAKSTRAATDAGAPAASEATPVAAATPEPAPGPGEAASYSVQVGAFVDLSQANEQVSRLRAAGYEARVAEAGAETRFRFQVRSGRYATREEASRLAGLLRAGGVAAQTVIVEPERK